MGQQHGGDPVRSPVPGLGGLVRAKLAPPRPPHGSVCRPQLLEVLRTGRGRSLTLVSAPAGFGKTTLLAEWVSAGPPGTFAWVSLDAGDGEPARFWSHVISALATVEPRVGTGSLGDVGPPGRILDVALPALFDELSQDGPDVVLVLDDYHRAETPEISAQLAEFLRYRPARVQVVVSTRSDPGLAVPTLRASGELVEVRSDDLRFDDAELSRFFDEIGVTGLSASDEHLLAERTGGWPAPLRLASLLMPDRDRTSFIESFTGASRHVVDYLARDVLETVEPTTRDFLLRVSILDRLNGPLCDAVTGTSGSGKLLAELERANLFMSVDNAGQWYHAHQLFSEALRVELIRTDGPLVPVLHARAATWLEVAGDLESATDHAIAAHDVALASRLVSAQTQPMSAGGRSASLRGWLAALSWPEAQQDPELAFVRALVASLGNDVDTAMSWLDVARAGRLDGLDAGGLSLGFRIDFLTSTVGVNDVGRAEAAGRRAVDAAPNRSWHGIALSCVGQALYLQGRTSEAVGVLRRALSEISEGNPIMLGFAVGTLGLAESLLGGESHADPQLDRMLDVLRTAGADRSPPGTTVLLAIGERARRGGDPRGAAVTMRAAIEVLEAMPRNAWLANAYLLLASTEWALGHGNDARDGVRRAQEVLDRLPDPGGLVERAAALRDQVSTPVHHAADFGEELSEREVVVLRLAGDGLQQREIADQLFISYNTVKTHLKSAYRKLGVASRAAALARLDELDHRAVPGGVDRLPANHPGEQGAG